MTEHSPSPFKIFAGAFDLWWRNWVVLAAINVVWALCCLSVALGPPATLAAYGVANSLARGEDAGMRDFWQAGQEHFLLGWKWFLSNVIVALLIASSLHFYAGLGTLWSTWLWALTLSLGALWLTVQFYALPYLLEQREKRLLHAYRNALFTVLASPLYTLVLLGMTLLIAALSVMLVALLFLGGPCLIAVLASAAVQDRLRAYGVLGGQQDGL
jgi:uncharacterized membrane protein YesL